MRSTGRVVRWQQERGFGFIAPDSGAPELFVHVSDVARGRALAIGGPVSYEVETGADGRKRAVRVERVVVIRHGSAGRRARAERPVARSRGLSGVLVGALLLGGAWLWSTSRTTLDATRSVQDPLPSPARAAPVQAEGRRCDGRRHCSQMTSCAEARWFLQHCPGVEMDGNHDGEPCEQQWCH